MQKSLAIALIIPLFAFSLLAGGKPTTVSPPTQLAGHSVVLTPGGTIQFITDQNLATPGEAFDSQYGPMQFQVSAKGNVLTIPLVSETNIYADGYLELKFLTPTTGTFYRMVYSKGTRGAGTKTTGSFTLL